MAHQFKPQNGNKWEMLLHYVTGKDQNNEIMRNVIDERLNNKVKSLEDVSMRKRSHCKKKKLARLFRNNPNIAASEAVKTIDPPSRGMSDPRSMQGFRSPGCLERTFSDNREMMSMSPLGMQTLNVTENKPFLKPIVPV